MDRQLEPRPEPTLADSLAPDPSTSSSPSSSSDPSTASDPNLATDPTNGARPSANAASQACWDNGDSELISVAPEHYEFEGEIARGGLGRISVARDRRLNRMVAVKELIQPSASSEARFLREIAVTVRLQHPNIVAIHEAGRWPDGQPFYAMNYVAGETLHQSIHKCKSVNDRLELLSVVLSVTDAVAFAHSQGIVHRDLKPANILVGPFGETVVIDWGLAKCAASDQPEPEIPASGHREITLYGRAIGTPPYLPPEQARGRKTNEQSDVYALGAILYHVLSGRRPFFEFGDSQLLDAISKHAPAPLGKLVPALPPDLVAIVEKAMRPAPAARYASAKDLGEDLRQFTSGRLVSAYQYGLVDLLLRLVRRNTAAFTTAAVFLIALAILAGVSLVGIRRERDLARYNELAARTEGDRARERADALLVSQAQALTVSDPTRALAWLKQLERVPPGAVSVAAQAAEIGVAKWILRGHTDAITCVDTSQDSRLAVSGSDDKTLRLWTLGGGVSVLAQHTDRVAACRFSPSGNVLASGGYDGRVVLWNLDTLAPQELAPNDSPVKSVAFSADGATLYAATQAGQLRWYQVATGLWVDRVAPNERWPSLQATPTGLLSGPHAGRFRLWQTDGSYQESPAAANDLRAAHFEPSSGSVALGAESGRVWAWQPDTNRVQELGQVGSEISALAHLPGTQTVIAATDSGHVVTLDHALHRKSLLTHTERVIELQTSSAGRFVASGGWDKQVLLYDRTSHSSQALLGHSDLISGLSFTPNQEYLVSASWDTSLRVWALNDGSHRDRRVFNDHQVGVHSVRFAPDGKSLLTGGHDNAVGLRNLETARVQSLPGHTDHVYRAIFSADGLRVASSGDDQAVHVWRASGESEQTLLGHTADVEELAFSDDGRWLASASEDHTARLWDTATWQSHVLPHDGNVTGVAFSADSKSLVTTSLDGKLRIFTSQTGEQSEVVNEHVGELTALAYASNGSLAAAAPTSNLVLWRSPNERNPHFFRNLVGARSLVFSRDARLLAVSGVGARLWICTLQTAVCREYPSTGGAIRSLRFSPDARSLVTGGSDSNVYIWDVSTTERRVLRGHKATIFDLDVSPDGQWVASAGGDASVRLWPLIPVPTAAMLRPALDAATTESVEPLRPPNANAPSTAP